MKKARVREGKKKESAKKKASVSDPSAKHNKQKTLPMVSMDANGGGGKSLAASRVDVASADSLVKWIS